MAMAAVAAIHAAQPITQIITIVRPAIASVATTALGTTSVM